jgi:two-component system LytT family response regulator
MINTILIDDEPLALKHLASLIGKYCQQLSVQATADSVTEGLNQLNHFKPELVFLDIELAGSNSFELLHQVNSLSFEKIFVTAYDNFGIQAIKHDASDYVLKPIDKTELIDAVVKAEKKIYTKRMLAQQQAMDQRGSTPNNRIALPTIDGLLFIDMNKILYCESEGRYTRFYMAENEKKILISKNIGEYEMLLPQKTFVRIHNHYIVNLSYVEKYVKGRGGYVVLTNGKMLEVSVRKKDDFFGSIEK